MNLTPTEENYLKAIHKYEQGETVSTSNVAAELDTSPASVTDMLKKMSERELVHYQPYRGVSLTESGRQHALQVIRKQRLWETFLVEKLGFTWDEVHETAEQLEHIQSPLLVDKLDAFLNWPRFDPHGDPIPDANGKIHERDTLRLSEVAEGTTVRIAAVLLHTPDFLRYLDRLHFNIGTELDVLEHIPFDESRLLKTGGKELIVGCNVAENLLVMPLGENDG